jgi:hypothetical protein
MKSFGKTLGLLLASLSLASCGGGGGNGGSYSPPESGKITLSATATKLPVNVWGYKPTQYGNPTQAEVTITWRNADGTLVTGKDIAVSISPTNVAALSCLVDGDACKDGNALFGSIPIKGINGQATIFVNATDTPGTANFTVSAVDPTTSRTVSASMAFTVSSGVGPAPANITLSPSPAGIYLPSSGGVSNSAISATVVDGSGQLVPDPVSGNAGVDNIQFEIVGNAGDARLSTSSVAGPVSGTVVKSHTVRGVATVSLQAGDQTPQGPVQVRATVDRADNNVSNGIQDAVSSTVSVIVSDGKLYSLELTSPLFAPNLPGITINTVSGDVSADVGTIPADPDATLSLTVSALATDRQGNPVIPGTAVRFGLIDAPVGAPGTANDNQFLLSGLDGNPQEGGTGFTAPSGRFTTAGGGAGPGDALIVLGKAVQGNADLESAVTVQRVNSATSLTVSPSFNLNNTTGTSVDAGPVLPYLIGRAQHGNVTASATTNAAGVAHGKINYTVNTVGSVAAVWVQGDGVDRVSGGARRVTDAGIMGYPGVAPATITAFPNPIVGNKAQTVTACVVDALGIPLRGVQIGFKFTLSSGGTGKIDGQSGSGVFSSLTGVDGCASGAVVTSGLPATAPGGNSGQIVFTGAGATSSPIDIVVEIQALQASPNAVAVSCTSSQNETILVRALGADGTALQGVDIAATCSASGGSSASLAATPASGTTGADGSVSFNVLASGFVGSGTPPTLGQGECKFSAANGARSVTVRFAGVAGSVSPPPVCGP